MAAPIKPVLYANASPDTPLAIKSVAAIVPRIENPYVVDVSFALNRRPNAFEVQAATVSTAILLDEGNPVITLVVSPGQLKAIVESLKAELHQIAIGAGNLKDKHDQAIEAIKHELKDIDF